MEKIHIENTQLENSLVVVSAKEHGKIFQIQNGEMKIVEYVEEHPPEYSDNEGFFFRSAHGTNLGSGNVHEDDKQHNMERYIKGITSELSQAIEKLNPSRLFLFEPEHMKGLIAEHVKKPNALEVTTVSYGNYVQADPEQIIKMLNELQSKDELDPADPASVAGEENAEEKRKILETGVMRDGE